MGSAVGRGHAGLGAQVGGARPVRHVRHGVTRRERYGDDEGAGRQVRPGRQDRADQRLGPGHDLGGPADQGQHQQARVQLARVVAQLPDVTPVQGAPGRVGEHVAPGRLGGAGQFGAHVLRVPPQRAERPVLGLAQRGDRPGQPDQDPASRSAPEPGQSLGDRQHGQRGALLVLQDQAVGVGRDRAGGYVEDHKHRPRRAVGQLAAFGHRSHLGGVHEAAQRGERPGREQLEVAQLRFAERAHGPVG